jgi:hypothetical protein
MATGSTFGQEAVPAAGQDSGVPPRSSSRCETMHKKERVDDETAAQAYRLCQATALLKLFAQAHDGREADDPMELAAWFHDNFLPRPIDYSRVLTREEIEKCERRARVAGG